MDGSGFLGTTRDSAAQDTAIRAVDKAVDKSHEAGEPSLFDGQVADHFQNERGISVWIDRSRDALLTDFGKATLDDRYLMPGESYQDLFARVAAGFADDSAHAQRLYDYISRLWFMPATPVLSNGGLDEDKQRGLPISCFLNEANDNLESIVGLWTENVWLAARGGGIGSYWGNLRSIGEKVGQNGKTSGIVPFVRVMDSLTLAISQGSLRRGSAAVYLPIDHPEIEEFVEIRRPTGGDPNRKAQNLHHGVTVPDDFMRAVVEDREWALRSPKDKSVVKKVSARALWIRILTARIETGEPYLIYSDHVNKAMPEHHKLSGLEVKMSNLCSEITLPTGLDHLGNQRTAVCCLSSLNLETFEEWRDAEGLVEDVMRFLDNVLEDFIRRTEGVAGFERARYSAMRERSVGLGVMGFHSYLQKNGIPWESALAKSFNLRVFKKIRSEADAASRKLAAERGPCPDAAEHGFEERFSNKLAIAPTASISIICGGASAGIEPIAGNAYTHKTLSGSFAVRNPHLERLLESKGRNDASTWTAITTAEGSVQHLDFLSDDEKDVFKTAFELDQRWLVEHAGDRAPYVCQAQSLNLFLPADVHKRDLHQLHLMAWKRGVKSLYYCRSRSLQRAESAQSHALGMAAAEAAALPLRGRVNGTDRPARPEPIDYEECLACQ